MISTEIPSDFRLPSGFHAPRVALPGVVVVEGPRYLPESNEMDRFCRQFDSPTFPLVVVVNDSEFAARTARNFLWVTFTRSNPAADIHGVEAFCHQKHWGCRGPLVIDARSKPHHAPALEDDPRIERRVDLLGAPGQPLHGII